MSSDFEEVYGWQRQPAHHDHRRQGDQQEEFSIGTRVRCRRTRFGGSADWLEGVLVGFSSEPALTTSLWPKLSSCSSFCHSRPYLIRLDSGESFSVPAETLGSDVKVLKTVDDWNGVVFDRFCQDVRSGRLSTLQLSGKPYSVLTDPLATSMGHFLSSWAGETSSHRIRAVVLRNDDVRHLTARGFRSLSLGIARIPNLESLTFIGFFFKGNKRIGGGCNGGKEEDDCKMMPLLDTIVNMLAGTIEQQKQNSLKRLQLENCSLPCPDVLERICACPIREIWIIHAQPSHSTQTSPSPLLDAKLLRRGLQRNLKLHSIYLDQCPLDLVTTWMSALSGHGSLKELRVENTPQPDSGLLEALDGFLMRAQGKITFPEGRPSEARAATPVLEKLCWASNGDDSASGMSELFECLSRHDGAFRSLDLHRQCMGDADAIQLRRLLEMSQSLRELRLPYWCNCRWGETGYWDVATGLERNRSLKELSIFVSGEPHQIIAGDRDCAAASTAGHLDLVVSALEAGNRLEALTVVAEEQYGASVGLARVLCSRLVQIRSLRRLDVAGCFRPSNDAILGEFWRSLESKLLLENLRWNPRSTSKHLQDEVNTFTNINRRWNRGFPRLLQNPEKVPDQHWPFALASVSPKPSAVFYLLRSYPAMVGAKLTPEKKQV